jgi:V8-like Glu-specific endopeptidase
MTAKVNFFGRALLAAAAMGATLTSPAFAGTPDVFTQYREEPGNNNAPSPPIGKLFLNGGYCSASVISGNNIIVTAAHCCWDRTQNNWIGGWSFVPGYINGNAPFGVFNWAQARVLNSWINNGDIASDVCLIALQNDSHGHGVTYYTGWLGRAWNWGPVENVHALGYPANLDGGNFLELCTAESFPQPAACGAGVLNMGCSMTFGSSGGPWIRNDYRTGNHVNSVVHGYVNQSCTGTFGSTFNGPQFTTNNIVTLCNAQGC